MLDGNLKTSMEAVHKDVERYALDLNDRISSLERLAAQSETDSAGDLMSRPSVVTAQNHLVKIEDIITTLENGHLEAGVKETHDQIQTFLDRKLPVALEPFRKSMIQWKSRFNASMASAGEKYKEIDRLVSRITPEPARPQKHTQNDALAVAALMRDVDSVTEACRKLDADVRDEADADEGEMNISVSGLVEQLKLELARARATADAGTVVTQKPASLDLTSVLQAEEQARRGDLERRILEIREMFESAEKQWSDDFAELRKGIQEEIDRSRMENDPETELERKIEQAREKVAKIERMIVN